MLGDSRAADDGRNPSLPLEIKKYSISPRVAIQAARPQRRHSGMASLKIIPPPANAFSLPSFLLRLALAASSVAALATLILPSSFLSPSLR